MGFLRKIFGGGGEKSSKYVDTRGVYFYVRCENCGTIAKLRADKEYDLQREGDGYSWHKTIVDNRCFRPIPTVVILDSNYEIVSADINGGEFVTEADFEAWLAALASAAAADTSEEE